jgi:hypothetical protein
MGGEWVELRGGENFALEVLGLILGWGLELHYRYHEHLTGFNLNRLERLYNNIY